MIVIPQSVKNIGRNAFMRCTSLGAVNMSNYQGDIPEGIFNQCTSLTTLKTNGAYTKVGHAAFYGCDKFSNMEYPRNAA